MLMYVRKGHRGCSYSSVDSRSQLTDYVMYNSVGGDFPDAMNSVQIAFGKVEISVGVKSQILRRDERHVSSFVTSGLLGTMDWMSGDDADEPVVRQLKHHVRVDHVQRVVERVHRQRRRPSECHL